MKNLILVTVILFVSNYLLAQNSEVQKIIFTKDSLFWAGYNTCDTGQMQQFIADDVEFYHDKGGLSRSKVEIVEATKKNICGKVTRELVKGSIEIYPINGYGAVEIGLHIFHNNQEPPPKNPKVGRFVLIWEHTIDGWKISRVISLH